MVGHFTVTLDGMGTRVDTAEIAESNGLWWPQLERELD